MWGGGPAPPGAAKEAQLPFLHRRKRVWTIVSVKGVSWVDGTEFLFFSLTSEYVIGSGVE